MKLSSGEQNYLEEKRTEEKFTFLEIPGRGKKCLKGFIMAYKTCSALVQYTG